MDDIVRTKIEMAERVRDFSRANPFADPTSAVALTRLDELLARASTLATTESEGRIERHASSVRRVDLRRALVFQFLRPVVRAGELAANKQPDLVGKFRLPKSNSSNKGFLMAATAVYEAAVARKDLFAGVGIPASVLDDLGQAIQEFGQVTEGFHIGQSKHVGARADLQEVTAEIMEVVGVLDGLNHYRFRNDTEKLAAWLSERNILLPRVTKKAVSPSTTPGAPPAAPDTKTA